MLLDYEKQVFGEMMEADGLLILARSLGLERILLNILKPFSHPASLVLVLNSSAFEEESLIEKLQLDGADQLPRVINSDVSKDERLRVYLEGGVLFVTSRILVVDLLTEKVPVNLITGIVVMKAHKVSEAGLEAFILRLYRQKNKHGFIKAFSDNPVSFANGYAHVEKVMKSLFLKKLYLYPRFHASVLSSLERHQAEVVELGVPCTAALKQCQMALLDLINLCIKELKLCNPGLDLDEVSTDNVITKAFDLTVRMQLDPIWHQLGSKTKQLVADLKSLREILRYLTQYDCITFYNMVKSIRSSEKEFMNNVGWLFTDAADRLFMYSQERVFGSVDTKGKSIAAKKKTSPTDPASIEENPKWRVLSEVLKEIDEEQQEQTTSTRGRVLIAMDSEQACRQIKQYLTQGGQTMMNSLLNKMLDIQNKDKTKSSAEPASSRDKGKRKLESFTDDQQVTLTQLIRGEAVKALQPDEKDEDADDIQVISSDQAAPATFKQMTVLLPLKSTSDPCCLTRNLESLNPRYIILYDVDISYIRQIELYKACRPGSPLRVYILMYSGSAEEQAFLTSIRKEKEAFELLIKQKASMVIPENRDGKLEDDPDLSDTAQLANQMPAASSRKGGLPEAPSQSVVIVDMREFRSDLPFLLHKRGMHIEPVTLEVGDYILTPDICVERKSVSDLIGSLNSGRLYSQCVSMTRYYKKPVLLIEFDPTKAFTLQKNFKLQQEISIQDIQSRLTLLTLHFPKLRTLWCQSPHATSQLFSQLKTDNPQPDLEKAVTVTTDGERDIRYQPGPYDFLMKIPNIGVKNVRRITDNVKNIQQLVSMTVEQLGALLDNTKFAESIVNFLKKEYRPEVKDSGSAAASTSGPPKKRKPTAGKSNLKVTKTVKKQSL